MADTANLGDGTGEALEQAGRAMALVREAMDQLAAEIEAEAIELSGPELLLQQALSLPRRAAALRDLSIALQEIASLERRLLGMDEPARFGLEDLSRLLASLPATGRG